MAKNVGKLFEEDWSNSVPQDCFELRLKDSAQSYNENKETKFAWQNPYDYILFNGEKLFCLELKSTCQKYMSFQTDKNDKSSKIIKWHQIEELTKASKYKNVVAGFILNFRISDDEQVTYYFSIQDFNKMKSEINKKSFTIIDAVLYGAKRIQGNKKRTRWRWVADEFIQSFSSVTQQ